MKILYSKYVLCFALKKRLFFVFYIWHVALYFLKYKLRKKIKYKLRNISHILRKEDITV